MTHAPFDIPDYWWARPAPDLSAAEQAQCDALLERALAQGPARPMDYSLDVPKWQFLCHVAERHPIVLHGSNQPDIARFEPRQPMDVNTFGAQRAVYAASDGIWPMYFAIVDRSRVSTLVNACARLSLPGNTQAVLGPFYLFSISQAVLPQRPYVSGTVYLLPSQTFQAEPPFPFGPMQVHTAQLASPEAVAPLAKLTVASEDFPFLTRMRGHDDARLADYAAAIQSGAPWPDERTS
jgi:hypothetical protein